MTGRGKSKVGGKGRGRVKRQEIESEDGWTVITHGLSKLNVNANDKKKSEKKVAGQLPTQIVKGLTAEKLLLEFKGLQERWEDTAVARQIKELVGKKEMVVREAVCIGIGSFARDWEQRWRSMWQLVLFVDATKHFNTENKYAQDPAFTPLDIEFLKLLGITATETGIEQHITTESFVFSPFVDWFILLPMFLKGKDPRFYMGNEILDDYNVYAQTAEKKEKLEECNELGKRFLEGRDKVKLKDFDLHAHAFNGMVIYFKLPSSDTDNPT
jgi:hypothetical protein